MLARKTGGEQPRPGAEPGVLDQDAGAQEHTCGFEQAQRTAANSGAGVIRGLPPRPGSLFWPSALGEDPPRGAGGCEQIWLLE